MKTKQLIIDKAISLFNLHGLNHVTLRDVAAALDKSYGNITYHFSTKEKLVHQIYQQYQAELLEIGKRIRDEGDFFNQIVLAPKFTFALSIKYLFLFKDYLEVRRLFPELSKEIDLHNEQRKAFYLSGLRDLRLQGLLRPDLTDEDLDTIMELSGAVRTLYFQRVEDIDLSSNIELKRYFLRVNAVLKPYLSERGLEAFKEIVEHEVRTFG